MSLQKIIITFFIVTIPLFFILNSTYFSVKDLDSLDQDLIAINNGFQEIVNSWNNISLTKTDKEENFSDNKMYVEHLNSINKVYFSSSNYSRKDINSTETFLIWSWGLYIFDLYDLTSKFNIDWKLFKIKPKSPWKFFIDNRNVNNIKVFSFDSIFDLALISDWKEMTNISIYPKMYFWFNSSRNKFLKNADLFRIETISNIFYVKQDLLTSNNKINKEFLNEIYHTSDKKAFDFLENFFKLSYSQEEINKYNELKIILLRDNKLNWAYYINKYFLFFLNNEKKVIYYKKNILSNLNNLFKKNWSFDKEEVLYSLEKLKNLNPKEYDEFKKILYYYYDNLLKINSLEYIDKIFIFSEIISKDEWNNNFSLLESSFFLNKIYSLVNNKTYNNDYLQANLLEFLKYYLEENKVDITENYTISVKNKNILLRMDYLSFFIKNILLYNLNLSDTKNLENIFNILKVYNNLNININNIKNYEKSETLIIENSLVVDKLLSEIRKSFFEKDLTNIGLLVLLKGSEISSKNLISLNEVMNSIFSFYTSKKWLISQKNQIYNDIYSQNIVKYKHFYDALNNYPEYLIKYDKVSSNLLDTKTIFENTTATILSKENLIWYLSSFDWMNFSNVGFEIVNNNYYKINNLNINWEVFSFNLYPQEFNRISDIVKNWEKLTMSYELDNIKYDWDQKYEQATQEEKDKYNFRKFFLNIFFNNTEVKKENFVLDDNPTDTEDRVVSIFKRDKLLWDRWEFSLLKGYLELKYNDIKVTLVNWVYNIKLENIIFKTLIDINWETIQVIWVLNSDYVFNEKDHYFKNISLKFYDANKYNNWKEEFLAGWKIFNVNKNINIIDFKNEMNNILAEYLLTIYKND